MTTRPITRYTLTVAGIEVEILVKAIKNLHVGVYPPDGRVRVSAPQRLDPEAIRLSLVSRIGWIRRRRAEFAAQERQTPREYISGESHYYLGRRYRLEVIDGAGSDQPRRRGTVSIHGDTLRLTIGTDTDRSIRERIITDWYRAHLNSIVEDLRERWEPKIEVTAAAIRVKKMKTKWGSCNIEARRVWLNLELVKKPQRCIEYILVHELVHLLERHHNERFRRIMDRYLPDWRLRRDELNASPLAHEEWSY